jgi:5-carboxymethyl-2-hydroxymuconate isomerase
VEEWRGPNGRNRYCHALMPHIVFEYTSDLSPLPDMGDVFKRVHSILDEVAQAKIGNSKSRAIPVDSYVGDGDAMNAFVHLDIRLMEGRSVEVKEEISNRCLAVLAEALEDSGARRNLQITVSVSDLERATYTKHPPGTIPPP